MIDAPPGYLVLQSLRSHDQWNTIPYAGNDRYRGIHNARRVVMVNPDDLAELGIADGALVDIVSIWHDGTERRAEKFVAVGYPASSWFGGRLLPGDQCAGSARQRGRRQQHADLEGHHRPAGACGLTHSASPASRNARRVHGR